MTALAIAALITAATLSDGGVPQAVLERLKTQEVQMVSMVSVQRNGETLNFATIYVSPYYIIVRAHRVVEGWQFDDPDILEVFIVKGEDVITIWARDPPATKE